MFFKDTFESAAPGGPRAATQTAPLSALEQRFWRLVESDADLVRQAAALKEKGRFAFQTTANGQYASYHFTFKGQPCTLGAEIRPSSDALQIRNYFKTCSKGLEGIFDRPNRSAYGPRSHRPL